MGSNLRLAVLLVLLVVLPLLLIPLCVLQQQLQLQLQLLYLLYGHKLSLRPSDLMADPLSPAQLCILARHINQLWLVRGSLPSPPAQQHPAAPSSANADLQPLPMRLQYSPALELMV